MTAPSPAEVYERILADVDDGTEREVFGYLAAHLGQRVTRQQLIFWIWGKHVPETELANSTYDRQVRVCIKRLRDKDFPIVSSSGEAGYTLKADENEIDSTIAEMRSKVESMQDSITHLYRSKGKARQIREYRETVSPPVQVPLF